MAPPGYCFRAHDGRAFLACALEQTFEAGAKVSGGHVVGVTAEGGVAPGGVCRIVSRVAQAAEAFQVYVIDSLFLQCLGKCTRVELRNVARFRNGADVHEALDAIGLEDRDKLRDRACRMPD